MNNPNYKLGIKKLAETQMKSGLPGYNMLKNKIDKIRNEAADVSVKELFSDSFETLKYDHIFSILGGRGAGKTSVMLTMYHDFKEKDENIVFPIIMPELIEEDEDIISWLLSAMSIQLNDFEGMIKKYGYKKDKSPFADACDRYNIFERCVFNKNNELRNKYETLKNAYYTRNYKYTANSYSEAREWTVHSAECSFSLMQMFVEYWNTLIDVYGSYKKIKAPLIFIFIDDADLKPQILNELLFVIPKYLSHPNVVVFVSASQKTLKYAVKNHMYKEITHNAFNLADLINAEYNYNGRIYNDDNFNTVRFHELRYGKEYDKINKLSDEILRKLFPVYNRLYLKKYDKYEEKSFLQIFKDNDSSCSETINLSDGINSLINQFFDAVIKMHEFGNVDNTIIQKKESSFQILNINKDNYAYLSFLGNYPRDIMNTYYALKDMLVNLSHYLYDLYCIDKDKTEFNPQEIINAKDIKKTSIKESGIEITGMDIEKIYELVIKFLDSAVMSNRKLIMFSSIVRDLVKTELLHWQLFVDYARVYEIYNAPGYMNDNIKNPDPFVEMLCLLNFVEQIIVLVIPKRKKTHGDNVLYEILDYSEINVIKKSNNFDEMIKQYYTFQSLNIIPKFEPQRIEHCYSFISGVTQLDLINYRNYKYVIIKNKEWYELYVKTIYHCCSPSQNINKYIDEIKIFKDEKFMGFKYNHMVSEYYEYVKKLFFENHQTDLSITSTIEYKEKMEDYLTALDFVIHNIELKLSKSSLDKIFKPLFKEIDYMDDKRIVKMATYIYTNVLSEESFVRDVLISSLNNIRNLIEESDFEYLEWSDWYRRLDNLLRRYVRVKPRGEMYLYYKEVINNISNTYIDYLNDYYIITLNLLKEKVDPIFMKKYNELKELDNDGLRKTQENEWRKFMGLE